MNPRMALWLLVLARATSLGGAFRVSSPRSRLSTTTTRRLAAAAAANDIYTDRLVQIGRALFQPEFSFPLDDWQCEAGGAIAEGSNVIVCAPTGAGKTVVGEMALIHADQMKKKGIYTTPLKALSNQKYTDLLSRFTDVGLSTGDISIRKGADVTVMTTEVYRNQASRFGSSTHNDNSLDDTAVVVLDEFHYMGMSGRGSVWEESVITSPEFVQLIALSATLSNARQLAEWIEHVTQRKTILVQVPDNQRPVPLRYLFATRDGLFSLFQDPDAGPGAPHGMLGWKSGDQQSDDECDDGDEEGPGQGFGSPSEKQQQRQQKKKKLPRGLHINPALKAAADKRLQRVNRAFERAKFEASLGGRRGRHRSEDIDDFSDRRKGSQSRKLSAKEEQKERERLLKREMRRSVPSLSALVQRLDQKELLPAIFFLFSRAGCDEAARGICQSMRGPRDVNFAGDDDDEPKVWSNKNKASKQQRVGPKRKAGLLEDGNGRVFRAGNNYMDEDFVAAIYESELRELIAEEDFEESSPLSSRNYDFFAKAGLLRLKQVEEVANRIAQFNKNNPEIAFEEDVIEYFLFGVGSHHAGQLPAHKSFVESLFQRQLMKVVFATETLAAGINMPARTTVICALAKRGDGSAMNLLETSNLLQMAGRAGRRGMDTSGTCLILATPFESENDAAKILTDNIKPIRSQFTPSYTLAVNLIARGEGKLDVAKVLVQKSFAMWQKRLTEGIPQDGNENDGEDNGKVDAQAAFLEKLVACLQMQVNRRSAKYDISRIGSLIETLSDPDRLKKVSKSYIGLLSMMDVERATLGYLQQELEDMRTSSSDFTSEDEFLSAILSEDESDLKTQIELQRNRIYATETELRKHPFQAIIKIVNDILEEDSLAAEKLNLALVAARPSPLEGDDESTRSLELSGSELSNYAKSFIVMRRKIRKAALRSNGANDDRQRDDGPDVDDAWSDFLAITKTLVAYGCLSIDQPLLSTNELETCRFSLTEAGTSVGMLGFENSLWSLVAMGGAWDVQQASYKLDQTRQSDTLVGGGSADWQDDAEPRKDRIIPTSQEEAEDLTDRLRSMSASEIAGYVACLVSDSDGRGDASIAIVDRFQRLTKKQQKAIQCSLVTLERFMEVQKVFSVDEKPRRCSFDISNCEVVSEWAAGCSWNEALALADAPPGDLVRTLSRALDGLRQLGNLPFTPVRRGDLGESSSSVTVPRGLHPEVRKLCRDAAKAINRYPVKDYLSFEISEEDEESIETEGWETEPDLESQDAA